MDDPKRSSITPPTLPTADGEVSRDPTTRGYRLAAAVLSSFNSDSLRPVEEDHEDDGDALLDLLEDCERVRTGTGEWRWMLKNSVRRQTLKELGTREAIRQALQANSPRPDDTLQRIFEAYIAQTAPPLEQQNVSELTAALQVRDWLEGILDGLPDRQALTDRLEWEQLLQPFRQLVGDHFRGRAKELAELREFFNVTERVRSIYQAKPLMIFGPGGVGKSTLLAKVVLETVDAPAVDQFAFGYWDFDRATLLPEEPVTLLAELVLQLGLQFPPIKPQAQELRRRWLEKLAESVGARRSVQTEAWSRWAAPYRYLAKRYIQESRGDMASSLDELRN